MLWIIEAKVKSIRSMQTFNRLFEPAPRILNSSNHFQRKGCHPDIDLLKAFFEDLFEGDEELPILFRIGDIDEYPDGLVPVNFPFVPPLTRDCLGLR